MCESNQKVHLLRKKFTLLTFYPKYMVLQVGGTYIAQSIPRVT